MITQEEFLRAYDATRAKGLTFMSLLDCPLPQPSQQNYHGATLYDSIATSNEDDAIAEACKAPRPNITIIPKHMPASPAAGYFRNKY